MESHVRHPIVAGTFYPADPGELSRAVHSLLGNTETRRPERLRHPVGLIAPHAGYLYSGGIAGAGYAAAAKQGQPDVVLVLGANHTGRGLTVTLSGPGHWETPMGGVAIDEESLQTWSSAGLQTDPAVFLREHSIEVQLPFLQSLWPGGFRLAPVCVKLGRFEDLEAAATILAGTLAGRSVLIVASTDFTHYESDARARELDTIALDRILTFDAHGFHTLVRRERLSICGAGAVTLLVLLGRHLGWTHAERVAYGTSGDITGDRSAVVGYAAALFTGGIDD